MSSWNTNPSIHTYYTGDPGDEDKAAMGISPKWKPVRTFETGATRDSDEGKFDYEGFLSPVVLTRYAAYMHKHRYQSDGSLRSSDNWQRGIPLDAYMKSGWRHFMDWWMAHRYKEFDQMHQEEALCALIFNAMGYLQVLLTSDTLVEGNQPER